MQRTNIYYNLNANDDRHRFKMWTIKLPNGRVFQAPFDAKQPGASHKARLEALLYYEHELKRHGTA